jgi:hypothetical protein
VNGYLVVGYCEYDDIPLYLCATREEATAFARHVERDFVFRLMARVAGRWIDSDILVLAVVEFRDGMPEEREDVRKFEEAAAEGG